MVTFKEILMVAVILLLIASCRTSHDIIDPKSGEEEWKLVWEDPFKDKMLDETKWSKIPRNTADWGNYMSSHEDCFDIKNDNLYLNGIINKDRSIDTSRYLTGGISTQDKFAFQYGKVEIRAKLENAKGAWPAIWMLADQPKYGAYPRNGEIDIMEHLNYENQVYQTVHSYYTLALKQKDNPVYYNKTPVDPETYNTYGLKWYPDKLVFTINDIETFIYPRLQGVDPTQWPFDQPFFLMIDMQLGGAWVGEVDPGDLPVQMIIDWVRVSQLK
ncbi:MAG: glycoside hydrolase family 16 protein [Saprospiraceae bacterium]|nr:glycoside hydrolase family 16 protein [Saprospiraceae bacterium]